MFIKKGEDMKKLLSILILIFSVSGYTLTKSAQTCVTGVQKSKFECASVIDFIVIDLYTQISRKDVERAVKAVEKQAIKDFAPKWGVSARFKLLPRGDVPTVTDNRKVLVYLVDTLINGPEFGASSHYIVQAAPNEFDGQQPNFWIPSTPIAIPNVPVGTPVIIIPIGDGTYGISQAPELPQLFFPGITLAQALSLDLSHEVLEALIDTFNGFFFLGAYQILTPGTQQTFAYIREVTDPVQFGLFNFYCREGALVQNFVLPDYFNPYADPTTCLDFLGNVKQPFTPFGGLQFYYVINCNGEFDQFFNLSFPYDHPENFITILLNQIYPQMCSLSSAKRPLKARQRCFNLAKQQINEKKP